MSTYPIKFSGENRWGVYQSNTCSMYSPTFDEWLPAFVFACQYGSVGSLAELLTRDVSDAAQERMSLDIQVWLDETFPVDRARNTDPERILPAVWLEELGCLRPTHRRMSPERILPAAWLEELDPLDDDIDLEDCPQPKQARCNHLDADQCCGGGAGHPCECDCHPRHNYDYDDLIADLEAGKRQAVDVVTFAFAQWRAQRLVPKVPA